MSRITSLCLAVILLAGAGSAFCAEFHPFLNIRTISDTNIYLDKTNPKSASITSIVPGLGLAVPLKAGKIGLSVLADAQTYSVSASTNNTTNSTVKLDVDYAFGKSIKTALGGTLQSLSDPASSELTQRVKRTQNGVDLGVDFALTSKLGLAVLADSVQHKYDAAAYANYNRTESVGGVKVSWALPKLAVFLRVNSNAVAYVTNTTDNNSSSQIEVGVERKSGGKTTTTLTVGQETRKYANRPATEKYDPFTVMALQVNEKLTSMTTLIASGEKKAYESTSYYQDPYFDSTGITAGVEQKIGSKVVGTLMATGRTNLYPAAITESGKTAKRTDTLSDIKLGVSYKAHKFVSVNVSGTSRTRDSNFTSWNYKDTLIELGINLMY